MYSIWALSAFIMLILIAILGKVIHGKEGRYSGALIDTRNRFSLSRLQITGWTLLFASSFIAIGISKGTMNLQLDPSLWMLMGISVASVGGAAIVKGVKTVSKPSDKAVQEFAPKMADKLKATNKTDKNEVFTTENNGNISPQSLAPFLSGVNQKNRSPKDARFTDIFKGEELLEFDYIDITKVQMFVFTLVLWVGYLYILIQWNIPDIASPEAMKMSKTANDCAQNISNAANASQTEETVKLAKTCAGKITAAANEAQGKVKDAAQMARHAATYATGLEKVLPGNDGLEISKVATKIAAAIEHATIKVINYPLLSQSLVTILGISHAGYLTVKAAPKTETK